ncbi:hypothetical protein SteCoe_13543 [Stentor coeruleus]|uniref:Uncharacterized protein n=1 Tax=Stentor coeruleus TaxID=5963 RepID=A0A1R2C893_9CILI|nr:hypothetical protein SteCoe_13543 [Stentor coeruleus]
MFVLIKSFGNVNELINMGCAISSNHCKIQRSTAIEILDDKDLGIVSGDISTFELIQGGKPVKVHFKIISLNLQRR